MYTWAQSGFKEKNSYPVEVQPEPKNDYEVSLRSKWCEVISIPQFR
jgi:hypothetical protein